MLKQNGVVKQIKPEREEQRLDGARVQTNITAVQDASKNLDLTVPPGVRLIKSEPWLTHLNVG